MGTEAIKIELIEWLTKLNDDETIAYLKLLKDANVSDTDWWYDLTSDQRAGIERGLNDINTGRVTFHDEVKMKYGL